MKRLKKFIAILMALILPLTQNTALASSKTSPQHYNRTEQNLSDNNTDLAGDKKEPVEFEVIKNYNPYLSDGLKSRH